MSSPKALALAAMVVLAGLLASGCGFRPLYGKTNTDQQGYSVQANMAGVEIRAIPNRLGQMVHNYLRDGLNPKGQPENPAYFLDVDVDEFNPGGLSRRDLGASRVNVQLVATFALTDEAGTVLMVDNARAVTGFDVFRDPLNDISALEDARERTAELLARMITGRVAAYFSTVAVR